MFSELADSIAVEGILVESNPLGFGNDAEQSSLIVTLYRHEVTHEL